MSNNRPPSSRYPERNPSSRRTNEYYGESSNRRNSPSPSRPPSSRSHSSPPPSSRGQTNRPHHSPNGRPPSRQAPQRSGRAPVKRRRRRFPILPLLILLAFVAVLAIVLRGCLINAKSNGDFSLELSSQTLVIGASGTAKVVGLPEGFDQSKISWSSSKPEIIMIDHDGTMQAKKVGEATIAASINGKSQSKTVKVVEMVDVQSITLDQTSATIASGQTLKLKADVKLATDENLSPPISWTSSNSSVARVSDGLVSARDVGTATITATVGNQSASCVITVQTNPNGEPVQSTEGTDAETTDTPADGGTTPDNPTTGNNKASTGSATTGGTTNKTTTGTTGKATTGTSTTGGTTSKPTAGTTSTVKNVVLSQPLGNLDVNETLTLEAAVSPAGSSVTWSSSNNKIATVSSAGVVTAKGAGTVTITAKAGGKSASCVITVSSPEPAQPPQNTESGTTE